MDSMPNFKSGYISIIGEPNAGKSTLMNAMLGEKLSIVTPKPQTTRKQILGIYSTDHFQIVFIDTPGIMKPKYKLHKAMINFADAAAADSDAIVLIIDAKKYHDDKLKLKDDLAFRRLTALDKPLILAMNKVDLISKDDVVLLIVRLSEEFSFAEIVPLSAIKSYNLTEFTKALLPYLPLTEPLYPTDILSTAPERFFVSELIREKIFLMFSEEIPYSTEVEVETFEENHEKDSRRKDMIRCAIIVERSTQKAILIGAGGEAIKKIGAAARKDIEAFLQRPVFLELFVKVREDWREKDSLLKGFGYNSSR
jgi:GTPase